MRKQNSDYNPHLVISIVKTNNGIEINEDCKGDIKELSALLICYLCAFCNDKGKSININPRDILMGIALPALHQMDDVAKDMEG